MVNVRDLKYVNDEKTYKYLKNNSGGGGGGDITVDDSMSSTSTNPVQNKVITNALKGKADSSSIDAKEDVDNKITAWSDTASDMKYPSEKLVKDEFISSDITLEQQATPETGCSATYVIKKGGVALSPKINIVEGSVTVDDNTIEKANGVIQLKSNGVGTQHLKSHCVTSNIIQDGAVDTSELADSSVTTGKLVDSCVTADKINDSAVTTDKLNDGSVNTVKIVDNSITYAKLDTNLVADNLSTDDATKVLSAKQGKVLDEKKIDKISIVDDLTSDDSSKVLSAKQGKVLADMIGGIEEDMLL